MIYFTANLMAEHELLDKIDFSDVIRDFADKKSRKKYCNRI